MSDSLREESLTVELAETISESNDEEVVRTEEIPTSSNISIEETKVNEKQENLLENKDENLEKVPLETEAITEIEKLPLQDNKAIENLIDSKTEQVSTDDDVSCNPPKESSDSPQQTSSLEENIVDNNDNEPCSEIPERLKSKDSSESTNKEDEIISPSKASSIINNSCDATKVDIDSPLKTSALDNINDNIPDKESISDSIITSPEKPVVKIDNIENEDVSSGAQKVIPDKDSSETTKSPVKPVLKIENFENEVSSSAAQKVLPAKDSSETTKSSKQPSSKDEYAEHVTYTDDGSAIYTDPQTKFQYKWCTKENNWIPCDANSTTTNPYENEHYKWCSETEKWIPKNTQVTETEHYKWDAEKNEWIAKVKDCTSSSNELTNPTEVKHEIDKEGQRTYTDKDGTVFFWDVEKSAWFPKIDDDFMARYQMSYGFIDNTSASLREKEELELKNKLLKEQELERMMEEAKANDEEASNDKKGIKRKAQQEPPKWFDIDPAQNTKVYVTNLPLDITLDEFADVMGKCGMIMRDPQTQKFKLKLYTEADGQVKGDGLCDYIKVESVDLALKILDEYELRGQKMRVQRAQFQMRGEYNPALKPKRKKKDKEKLAKIKEKLFDWRPEKMRGERSKHEKTVIIKNLFHPELFEKEVQLILDYQTDLREECAKCGSVRKVVVYDRHLDGVAQINMSSPEEADLVIQMMQGRFFGKRQLTAEHWDGKTKYKVEETAEDVQKRLNKWDQYLETEENKKSEIQKPEQPSCENPNSSDLEKQEQSLSQEKNDDIDLEKSEQSSEQHKNSALEKQELSKEKNDDTDFEKSELSKEKNDSSALEKSEESKEKNDKSDLEELSKEKNDNSNLEEQSIENNENSDLQKEEQDIEKTINFESIESSPSEDT